MTIEVNENELRMLIKALESYKRELHRSIMAGDEGDKAEHAMVLTLRDRIRNTK